MKLLADSGYNVIAHDGDYDTPKFYIQVVATTYYLNDHFFVTWKQYEQVCAHAKTGCGKKILKQCH